MEREAVAHQQLGSGRKPAAGGSSPHTGRCTAARCATQHLAACLASAAAGAGPIVPAGAAAEAHALTLAAEVHPHSCTPHTGQSHCDICMITNTFTGGLFHGL